MLLGQFISKKMREKGMSLYFLAKATDISYPYLLAIEQGKRNNPSYDKLKRIANALRVEMRELLEEGGFEEKTPRTDDEKNTSATDHLAPQRVPQMPWYWLVETGDIEDDLKSHTFRQARYTQVKGSNLYAVECGKKIGDFDVKTILIFQIYADFQVDKLYLIKDEEGRIGVYKIAQLGDELVALPQGKSNPPIAVDSLDRSQKRFWAQIKEAITTF